MVYILYISALSEIKSIHYYCTKSIAVKYAGLEPAGPWPNPQSIILLNLYNSTLNAKTEVPRLWPNLDFVILSMIVFTN